MVPCAKIPMLSRKKVHRCQKSKVGAPVSLLCTHDVNNSTGTMLLHHDGHYYADALWHDKEATIIHSHGTYVSHCAHHDTICNSCTITWEAAPQGHAATALPQRNHWHATAQRSCTTNMHANHVCCHGSS